MTYVGILVATTKEKIKQGGLVLDFYLLEKSADSVVLQEIGHDIDICAWIIVCGHEDFHGDSLRDKI